MKKFLIILLSLFSLFTAMNATDSPFATPDFAYPKQVTVKWEKELDKGLKESNNPLIVRSLLNIGLAESEIDKQNRIAFIKKIEEISRRKKTDPELKALLSLLQAEIYSSIYNSQRWKYNERQLPLSPLPENCDEWSGDQFKAVIFNLLTDVSSYSDTLAGVPLKKYDGVISRPDYPIFFPTLWDFAAYKIINIISAIDRESRSIPDSPANTLIDSVFSQLTHLNSPETAPYLYARASEINYSLSDSDEKAARLIALYRQNSSLSFSALPLLMPYNSSTELYLALEEYLKNHPSSIFSDDVELRIKTIMNPSVTVRYLGQIAKGTSATVHLSINNARRVKVSLYSVTPAEENGYNIDKLISDTIVETPANGPFQIEKDLPVLIPDYGLYTILASPDTVAVQQTRYYDILRCSDLYPIVITESEWNGSNVNRLFVADMNSGKPVSGVDVLLKPQDTRQMQHRSVTDASGEAISKGNGSLFVSKGSDTCAMPLRINTRTRFSSSPAIRASITTSLPIYHFGDSMEWVAILYQSDPLKGNSVLPDHNITVQIFTPNHILVNSFETTTDQWGRASGKVALPTNGLSGNFSITVLHSGDKRAGSATFMVSDYKLPTFTVEVTDTQIGYPSGGDVTISGKAMTYSGFPVQNADINAEITVTTSRSWWNSSQAFVDNISAHSLPDGSFSITIPKEKLDPFTSRNNISPAVTAKINVTSASGESRFASTIFSLGKPYSVRANLPVSLDVDKPVSLNISLINTALKERQAPFTIDLFRLDPSVEDAPVSIDDSIPVATFSIPDGSAPIDFGKLPSGQYIFRLSPADSSLALPFISSTVFIYRNSQKEFPLSDLLWSPLDNTAATLSLESGKGDILLGTSRQNLPILAVMATSDTILSSKWIDLEKGMSHLPVELPSSVDKAALYLVGVNGSETFFRQLSLQRAGSQSHLVFTLESFRDKVVPLSTETWKFKVQRSSLPGLSANPSAVILQMLSQAVSDLESPRQVSFSRPYIPDFVRMVTNHNYFIYNNYYGPLHTWNPAYYRTLNFPSFILYGLSWGGIRIYGARNYKAAEVAVVEEYATSMKMMARASADSAVEAFREDSLEDEVDDEADAGAGDNSGNTADEYRPSEIPLALFEPLLVTDNEGNLEYSVTFPNASTCWILNATAFDRETLSQTLTREIVASHPLMIQTSLPRFMRVGDSATLSATVMNNSGEDLPAVSVRLEAVDPANGNILAFSEQQISISNGQSALVTMDLLAQQISPGIIIRARAGGGNFSDGEQLLIAILEAAQPVVETKPFFLDPECKATTLDIHSGTDASVTLEFYQNPTWSVVTALPALRAAKISTSIEAASAICSAAIAENLVNRYPAIGTAIRQWLDSDRADSTLVSMLQRNPDLKIALLEATPWMTDAMSDTQRMQRLALLFDRKEISDIYSTAIHELARLQRSKGWAWVTDNEKPSYWATLQILETFGYLKGLGCLPPDKQLETMIKNAVEYIDSEAVKQPGLKKGKVSPDITYTIVRTPFTDIRQPSAARRITEVTIQDVIAHWKNYSIRNKAFAAILLAQNNYPSSAAAIVSSISEYSLSTPQKGLHWSDAGIGTVARILQAYALTSQPRSQIDAIRQWLILEKSSTNWGNSSDATCVIYNILATGSQWTPLNPGSTVVKIGSRELTPDKVDNITGYFRVDISDAVTPDGKTEITAARTGNTPAYGSVYIISRQQMQDIAPASCSELSVTKRFLVKETTPDGTTWKETTSFNVGDIVKVSLTINVNANMQYVVINDKRAACLEPVNQLPARIWSENLLFYRQTGDSSSDIFIDYLPAGTYILEEEFTVTHPGQFTSGIATVQSQYAPQYTSHSAGYIIHSGK